VSVVARISAAQFQKMIVASPALSSLCIDYNEVLLAQARVTAACNLTHHVEQRFSRWLLQSRDRAESDVVPLTQEFLSEMLGVRRTSVTGVAIKMQEAGTGAEHTLRMTWTPTSRSDRWRVSRSAWIVTAGRLRRVR
jgi:CRP-like cAMP-binding protein